MAKDDLTFHALVGYSCPDGSAPSMYSSPVQIAWAVGRWLSKTGRSKPRNVRMSRGYTVRANDMLLRWHSNDEIERIN